MTVTVPLQRSVESGTKPRRNGNQVDVVIVAYRSRDLLLACLDSLSRSASGLTASVTVVDNDSRDGTAQAVAAHAPTVRMVEMGYNAGFACANNRGFACGSAAYVLVLNPDTVLTPSALLQLVDFADGHPDVGVVAPKLLNPDGSDQLTARSFPSPSVAIFGRRSPFTKWFPNNRWSSRFLIGRGHPGTEPFEVDWVSGACMLVPRRVVVDVGAFDEGFFLFWEDADWCRRIKDSGYTVWCVPQAAVFHDEGGTRGHGWPPRTIRWFHAGAYRYWRKHHAPQLWNPLRWLALALLSGRAGLLLVRYQFREYIVRASERRSDGVTE